MKINGKSWETIWIDESYCVNVINQTLLPHQFKIEKIENDNDAYFAIKNMIVRGAPLIGVTGAYGLALGLKSNQSDENLTRSFKLLESARPTAVNLSWALKRVYNKIIDLPQNQRFLVAIEEAKIIAKEDIWMCSKIGDMGLEIIKEIYLKRSIKDKNKPINILTHCNAGWFAAVDWGTALAPIYKAHRESINIHVWVDETRPRNQGASLTAFELSGEGIPHTVIVDNAGGHLMQNGLVDLVIVGCDRATSNGDICNKIGTYLKALAARDNNIPFYAALPVSTIDWDIDNGIGSIDIENRSSEEVSHICGLDNNGDINKIRIIPKQSKCLNPGFDVTPASLVTGIITEKGICKANKESLKSLYSK